MTDRGAGHETGCHDGTGHICATGGRATFDSGRFTACPLCGFKPEDS